jgi:hypothetical protein
MLLVSKFKNQSLSSFLFNMLCIAENIHSSMGGSHRTPPRQLVGLVFIKGIDGVQLLDDLGNKGS